MSEENEQDAPLKIRLFGTCEAWVEGKPLPRLRSRQGWWLLALLTLRQGRDVSRTWLQATLWPDSLPEQAAYNLRRSLSDLRGALGAQAARVLSPTSQTLRLDLAGADVDTLTFDRLAKQGEKQGDTDALEQAAQCYRGTLLAECGEEWILEERAFRQEAYLALLETLAAQAQEGRDPAAAIPCLRRVIAIDALRESAHRRLMRVLAQTGAYAGATQVFRDLRVLLRNQFPDAKPPVAPDAETVACYRELRREARRKAALNETPDKQEREELALSGIKPASPAAPASAPPRHNLPRPRTTFIGREKEIAEAGNRLKQAVLLTLTGPGGAGKTRLAQQIARAHLDAYPDGAWLVELAALSEPSLVPQAIAGAVNATEPDGSAPTLATLLRFLESRALLLVLDNCEHLIEACGDVADALLAACPNLRILATSRQALNVTGEWLYPVPPLGLPDSAENTVESAKSDALPDAPSSEAVRLFVERARLVSPDFALTPHNAAYVAQICRDLDGLPLAIELAAARIRALSPEQIAARMNDRFTLLTGGNRTAQPRQRTMRDNIDWSYDLSTARERAVFERVSVFAGGFTLESAEFVCLPPLALASRRSSTDMLDTLTRLVDQSLVLPLPTDAAGEPDRFHLLETLRQYGQEKLQAGGEEADTRARHRDFCLMLAEQAQVGGQGAEQVAWYNRLEREADNLRAALAWSLEQAGEEKRRREDADPEHPNTEQEQEKTLRLANALGPFWKARGYLREGRKWLTDVLECCPDAAPNLRAAALHDLGSLALQMGDYEQAKPALETSLALRRQEEDTAGIADTLTNLGILAAHTSDVAEAQTALQASLEILRARGDSKGIADALVWLGTLAYQENDRAEAQKLFAESLEWYNQQDNLSDRAHVLNNLAILAHEEQQFAQARLLYRQCLDIHQRMDNKTGIAAVLNNLGNVLREEGQAAQACQALLESLTLYRMLEDEANLPLAQNTLGMAYCALQDWRVARACFVESADAYARRQEHEGLSYALMGLANVAVGQGQGRRSARLLGAAQKLRDSLCLSLSPSDQRDWERTMTAAQQVLPSGAFAAAWQEGQAMPLEQALADAFAEDRYE